MPHCTEKPATSPSNSPPVPDAAACPKCGSIAIHRLKPGTPPHAWGMWSVCCDAFVRWYSAKPQAERDATRQFHRQAALAAREPTAPQMKYLDFLGYSGAVSSFLSASEMITTLVHRGIRS